MASLQREEKHLILFLTMPQQDSSSVQQREKMCRSNRKSKKYRTGAALATGAKVKIHQFQNEIDELLVTKHITIS